MTEFKPLREIVIEGIKFLDRLEIRKYDRFTNQLETIPFLYGGVDAYTESSGKTVVGIRVFHSVAEGRGVLNKTSHRDSPRRDEEKGILIPFDPEEKVRYWYRKQ